MNQKSAWQYFSKLPLEAQQQVIDFIAFLQTRHLPSRSRETTKVPRLSKEAFVGMWQNREDLQDSTKWMRNLREQEWGKR
jgi:hypothetical protein